MLLDYKDTLNGSNGEQYKEDMNLPFEERRQDIISAIFFCIIIFECFEKSE